MVERRKVDPVVLSDWAAAMRRDGLSPGTIQARRYCALDWFDHVGTRWPRATCRDVERWVDAHDWAPRSRATGLSHLHCFYLWALRTGAGDRDPTVLVPRPKLPHRLPRPARRGDLEFAVLLADPLMRAILLTMALAGLRSCEVAVLRWRDVDLDARVLWVIGGKGGRDRVVSIPDQLLDALASLEVDRSSDWVIGRRPPANPANRGHWVSRAVAVWLDRCGVDATGHQLRHWYGTEAYRRGVQLLELASAMGHSSVATTQIYVAIDTSGAAGLLRGMQL